MKYLHRLLLLFAVLFFSGCTLNTNPNDATGEVIVETAFPNLTFTRPVDLQHPGDGSNRLFVVEQSGVISVFENDSPVQSQSTFLNIEDRVNDSGNEEGLLGLVFHPEYEQNGYFYVDYTASNPRRTVIARYSVSPGDSNSALPESEHILLEVNQPYSNHNGGQITFGPDGYLYIAFGDGGSGNDPQGNGQNRSTLLGSIVRIDVDNPDNGNEYGIPDDNPFAGNPDGHREEIYAYGLRNPWRFSFDAQTDSLWAADVGQGAYEEVDIIRSGENYGWNIMEGFHCLDGGDCDESGLTMPIVEYGHDVGQSITGGFVYRGSNVPQLIGKYIYADFVSGRIWSLEYSGGEVIENAELFDTDLLISTFGTDANNELFFCAFDGKIYKFTVG